MSDSPLPQEFTERLKLIVPEKSWQPVYASFFAQKPTVLRINTLRTSSRKLKKEIAQSGIPFNEITWKQDVIIVGQGHRDTILNSKWYESGLLYSQSLSSQLAPLILDPQPGEEILDLCAAPGGKTLQMACMLNDTGRIGAVEKVKTRFFKLKANIKSQGASCIQTFLSDGSGTWRKTPERFDRVLLDAPCSSESRFQANHPKTYTHWRVAKIKEMARKQKTLIHSAIHCLKPGGTMVYSTCSFAPEENEAIIDYALKKFGGTTTVESIELPIENVHTGLLKWKNRNYNPEVQKSIRILPNEQMDGFFICRIKKKNHTFQRDRRD